MELNRGSAIPLWYQIAEILGQEISSDVHRAGRQFPTESLLTGRFGVNRHTVRRAVASLADQGLVRVEKGRGTFVEDHVIDYRIGKRTRFSANLLLGDVEPGHRLIGATELPATETVSAGLGIARGDPVTLLETIGEANGHPISVAANYFPSRRFPGLADLYERILSITKALESYGIDDYTRQSTKVMTTIATPEDTQLLKQRKNMPVLVVESVDVDPDGLAISYHVVRFAGERVQLTLEP